MTTKDDSSPRYDSSRSTISSSTKKSSTISSSKKSQSRYSSLLYIKKNRDRIPVGSLIALLTSWIGLGLFCTKTYRCAQELESLSEDLFAFLIPWIRKLKIALIVLAIFMICVTIAMTIVGFLATAYCHCSYKNKKHLIDKCRWTKFGGRLACGTFWLLAYLLNLCWLGILSITVVMTSAYFAFLPVCLPQAGLERNFCFNFTLFSLMISGGKNANVVSLILCGDPIDKFCKLSKGVMPWFWGSFFGCVIMLLGLSHFNATLAANFAHNKHALRYKKLHSRLRDNRTNENRTKPEPLPRNGHDFTKKPLQRIFATENDYAVKKQQQQSGPGSKKLPPVLEKHGYNFNGLDSIDYIDANNANEQKR